MIMKKKKVFMAFQEEGVYDTWTKGKSIEGALDNGVAAMLEMIDRGYDIDFFQVSSSDVDGVDGYSIRVTGDRIGG